MLKTGVDILEEFSRTPFKRSHGRGRIEKIDTHQVDLMRPESISAAKNLANVIAWFQMIQNDDKLMAAWRCQDIALALHPYDPKYLIARARFLIADGKMAMAKRDLDRALFFGAYDDEVRDGLRKYYLAVDDAESALEEAANMVRFAPRNLRNHMLYGVTLYWGEDCRAGEVLKQYLEALS